MLDGSDSRVVIHNNKKDPRTGLLYIDENTTIGFGSYNVTSNFKYGGPIDDVENKYIIPSGAGYFSASTTQLQFTIETVEPSLASNEYKEYKDADLKQLELTISELENALKNPTTAQFKGKKVSYLGDSVTTFDGYIAEDGEPWYPKSWILADVEDTYWWKLNKSLGMELLVNQSNNGMSIARSTPTRGNNGSVMDSDRALKLHTAQGDPDIVIIQAGYGDFYYSHPLGTYNGTTAPPAINSTTLLPTSPQTTFREAYAVMLLQIQTKYPKAQIYCCTIWGGEYNELNMYPNGYPEKNSGGIYLTEYNQALREVATAFGCRVVELAASGLNALNVPTYMGGSSSIGSGKHPNKLGMELIFQQIRGQMLSGATTAITPAR